MSSGIHVELLRRRALSMLEGALWRFSRGEYDLACFEAEQAVQLYTKSMLIKLVGSAPRIHSLSELLGFLYSVLRDRVDVATSRLAEFLSRYRRSIWFLEESYYRARYGYIEYSESDARECIDVAKRAIELLREVENLVGSG